MDKSKEYLSIVQKWIADYYLQKGRKGVVKAVAVALGAYYLLYTLRKNNGYLRKKSVRGQHVFITGAGSGIGKQMAIRFAKLGANVTLADINQLAVEQVAEEIKTLGYQNVFAVKCDVSSIQSVKSAGRSAVQALGDVDILINNAGIVTGKKLLENTEQGIERTIAINTTSHSWTVREFLPSMLNRNKGHIVTVASIAGWIGVNGLSDYCASKFGAVGFNESLRFELRAMKSNVKSTCICPYFINTGMFNGVRSKVPFLLPIMTEEYATDRIMWGILQDEQVVILPWACNLGIVGKCLLPTSWNDWLCELLGTSQSMDHFVGRQQQL